MSAKPTTENPAPEKPKAKKGSCLLFLLVLFGVLAVVAIATSRAREKIPASPHKPMPKISDMVDLDSMKIESTKPASPVPAPRRIVSNDFSEAHSADALSHAIGYVQTSHPQLKNAVFNYESAGVVYFSDGTFAVSSWCDWKPQGQSIPVRSFFKVSMSLKNGEWYASDLKMSGWGF